MISSTPSATVFAGNNSTSTPYPVTWRYISVTDVHASVMTQATGTVTVAAGVATFTSPQTSLGVGKRVRIAGTIYFIDTRTSDTVFTFTARVSISATAFYLPDSATELAYGTEYSVGLDGVRTVAAVPVTSIITVYRITPLTQLVQLPSAGSLPSVSLESMADKLTMICQELRTALDGVTVLVPGGALSLMGVATFADATARAGTTPAFIGQPGVLLSDDPFTFWIAKSLTTGDWGLESSSVPMGCNILFEGDSIVQIGGIGAPGTEWPAQLLALSNFAGRYAGTANYGLGGSTLASMTARYTANIHPWRPSVTGKRAILFVMCGTNSITAGISGADCATAIAAYAALAAADGIEVRYVNTLPHGSLDDAHFTELLEYNRLTRSATWWTDYYEVDRLLADSADTNFFDGFQLHPTPRGAVYMAQYINWCCGQPKAPPQGNTSGVNTNRLRGVKAVLSDSLFVKTTDSAAPVNFSGATAWGNVLLTGYGPNSTDFAGISMFGRTSSAAANARNFRIDTNGGAFGGQLGAWTLVQSAANNTDFPTTAVFRVDFVGRVHVFTADDAAGPTTAAFHVVGGAAIEKKLWVSGNALFQSTGSSAPINVGNAGTNGNIYMQPEAAQANERTGISFYCKASGANANSRNFTLMANTNAFGSLTLTISSDNASFPAIPVWEVLFSGNMAFYTNLIVTGLKATAAAAPTIASAGTIAPTKEITVISGAAAIATITPPSPISLTGGSVKFIPTGLWTWTNAGNIAIAGSAVVSRVIEFTWDVTLAKWYPSYV